MLDTTRKGAVEGSRCGIFQYCNFAQTLKLGKVAVTLDQSNWDFNGPERQIRRRELSKTYSLHITNEVLILKKGCPTVNPFADVLTTMT